MPHLCKCGLGPGFKALAAEFTLLFSALIESSSLVVGHLAKRIPYLAGTEVAKY